MARSSYVATLLLVIAAALAPAALAERPDEGMLRVGGATAVALPDRPDDRGGARGPGAISAAPGASTVVIGTPVRPDDRGGVRGPGPTPVVLVTQTPSGFDWGDAGIGALGAFGIALLFLAATQLLGHSRRRRVAV